MEHVSTAGRVLDPLLSGPPPPRIATHESSDWPQAEIPGPAGGSDEAARLEQLRALGSSSEGLGALRPYCR